MKRILKKIFQTSTISSIVLIAFGISLILQVETTIVAISYIIGAILALLGIVAALKYIRTENRYEKSDLDIVYAMVCFILGVMIIKNPFAIQNAILFVVGLIILFNSATKLQYGIELKRHESDIYLPTIIISILMAVCGIFLMFKPDIASNILGKIVGSLIVLYAVLDLATTIIIKKTFRRFDKEIKEAKIEEIEDENQKKIEKKSKKSKNEDEE